MDNPYTRGAQDTGRRQNKTQHRKLIGQYRMDNPYTRGAQDTGRRQTKHNTEK